MKHITEERLGEIERILRNTPPLHPYVTGKGGVVIINGPFPIDKARATKEFVVALRNECEALTTTIRDLWQELAEARKVIEFYAHAGYSWWEDNPQNVRVTHITKGFDEKNGVEKWHIERDNGARARAWLTKSGEGS